MQRSKTIILGGASVCTALVGVARGQVCTAADSSYLQTSDCSTTTWQLGARWSNGAGGSGSDANIMSAYGNSVCLPQHTACDGSNVQSRLYPATESFTWETNPSDDQRVDFYWSIGNQSDTINECTPTSYDETVYVGYYSFTGYDSEWCN